MRMTDRLDVWLFINYGWLSWIYFIIVCFLLGVVLYFVILNVTEALESKGSKFREKTSKKVLEIILIILRFINKIIKMSKKN